MISNTKRPCLNSGALTARFFLTAFVLAGFTLASGFRPAAAGGSETETEAVIAPTGEVLCAGAPVLVQWTSSFWPSSTVNIGFQQVSPAPKKNLGSLAAGVLNNGETHVNLPQSLACNPSHIYQITVGTGVNDIEYNHASAYFKLCCTCASLTVVKTLVNNTGVAVTDKSFPVDVNCGLDGPKTTLLLSEANNFKDSVKSILPGKTCRIKEQAPTAPLGCQWETTYPKGKSAVIVNGVNKLEVRNSLSCEGTGSGPGPGSIPATGSLTVVKTVVINSTVPPPTSPFLVQVTCSNFGSNALLSLTGANSFTQTVSNIPANSVCSIAEQAPIVPASLLKQGCKWTTTYPSGQSAVMPDPAAALTRTVQNKWTCDGGNSLVKIPGSLTILKKVVIDSNIIPPTAPFLVQVACSTSGPNALVSLSGSNNFKQTVPNIGANSVCTLTEQAPFIPADLLAHGCKWTTTYPDGKTASIPNPAAALTRTVLNLWTCDAGNNTGPGPDPGPTPGSLKILKEVIINSTITPPTAPFKVQVTCDNSGPNLLVSLSNLNGFTQTVSNIPANSACTITEQAPFVPAALVNQNCKWKTSYPDGQNAAMPDPAMELTRTVRNTWSCDNGGGPHLPPGPTPGSLTILKEVIINSNITPPTAPFKVQVTCNNSGPNVLLSLSSINSFTQTVNNVPANSVCTVTEQAPVVTPAQLAQGCSWTTSYPNGQNAAMPNPATALTRNVINTWTCDTGDNSGPGPDPGPTPGSLTILKEVVMDSTVTPPTAPFKVQVTCDNSGPNLLVSLSNSNGFTQTVSNIPANSSCTITEQAPFVPAALVNQNCKWKTSYPDGQNAVMPDPATELTRTVLNNWSCDNGGGEVPVFDSGPDPIPGSLTILKEVVLDSTITPPTAPFKVQVTCDNSGPNLLVSLSNLNGFTQTVGNIPANSSCTITEQAPFVPAALVNQNCKWKTSYPDGQNATMPDPAAELTRTVRNTWSCDNGGGPGHGSDPVPGTLTVVKSVVNKTAGPLPASPFLVQVNCLTSGPNVLLSLSNANSFTQTVSSVPVNSVCSITEQAPVVTPAQLAQGCSWTTSYPNGQNATMPNPATDLTRNVINTWACVLPPPPTCADPAHVPAYNNGSTPANNVPLTQCYKNTSGECLYNWRTPANYNDGSGWNKLCPVSIAGAACCGWPASVPATGTITVVKTVVNKTAGPLPASPFLVQVTCPSPGPSALLSLSNTNSFTQTVSSIPVNSACTITEQAPVVTPAQLAQGCSWTTSYPNGQNATMPNPATALTRTVLNTWNCVPPPGTITVVKTVVNNTTGQLPTSPFLVQVNCPTSGPNVLLSLSNANSFTQTVSSIPVNSACTITEQAPVVTPAQAALGCSWTTSYPAGQNVTMPSPAAKITRTVVNAWSCIPPPGTLTVVKSVVNKTAGPLPASPFLVQVNCPTSGPNVLLSLSNANSFTQTVSSTPVNSACTITEQAPVVTPAQLAQGCSWTTSYPNGQNATMPNPATALKRTVLNTWDCAQVPSSCCTPDWNAIPTSSFNDPALISACAASPQVRCNLNGTLKCAWNTQDPHCGGTPPPTCADPAHVPAYNNGSTPANNVPLTQCYKNTSGECLYNWRTPANYNDGSGWNKLCPGSIAGTACCGWPTSVPATGEITVIKTVTSNTKVPTPTSPFQVQVTCPSPGPSAVLSLSNANNFTQTLSSVPASAACTINEVAPLITPALLAQGCRWTTSYPDTQSANMPSPVKGLVRHVANAWSCVPPTGTLTVVKTVVNNTTGPLPTAPFKVQVNCLTSGPNLLLSLSGSNSFTQTVNNIPANSVCTITEQAPHVTASQKKHGCSWTTSYPGGQTATIPASAANSMLPVPAGQKNAGPSPVTGITRTVLNTWSCDESTGTGTGGGAGPVTGTGSLTVVKTVVAHSAINPPADPFLVQVNCSTSGPSVQLSLSDANGFTQTVNNIPANSVCTITEQAPVLTAALEKQGCSWETSYPGGQTATFPALAANSLKSAPGGQKNAAPGPVTSFTRTVLNTWTCDEGPETGTITVTKKIRNKTHTPTPVTPFQVKLDCKPGGPHQLVALTSPDKLQQTFTIPSKSVCFISEVPPVAPKLCHWETSYPNDQEGGIGTKFVIENELLCDETGTLTVTKKVRDMLATEQAPDPAGGFQVTVACNNGFSKVLRLGRDDSETISGLPIGTSCTVSEALPSNPQFSAPLSCPPNGVGGAAGAIGGRKTDTSGPAIPAVWNPASYSPGATVIIAPGANAVRVNNTYGCSHTNPS